MPWYCTDPVPLEPQPLLADRVLRGPSLSARPLGSHVSPPAVRPCCIRRCHGDGRGAGSLSPPHGVCCCVPVLDDHQNPRLIKDLLQDLSSTLCILLRGVGKSVLVGNINIWVCRLETVLRWQQQLQDLQVTKVRDTLVPSVRPQPRRALGRLFVPGASGPEAVGRLRLLVGRQWGWSSRRRGRVTRCCGDEPSRVDEMLETEIAARSHGTSFASDPPPPMQGPCLPPSPLSSGVVCGSRRRRWCRWPAGVCRQQGSSRLGSASFRGRCALRWGEAAELGRHTLR